MCLLDIHKAFDSVYIPGMLYTLYQTGIEGKLWRIIKGVYSGYNNNNNNNRLYL